MNNYTMRLSMSPFHQLNHTLLTILPNASPDSLKSSKVMSWHSWLKILKTWTLFYTSCNTIFFSLIDQFWNEISLVHTELTLIKTRVHLIAAMPIFVANLLVNGWLQWSTFNPQVATQPRVEILSCNSTFYFDSVLY